VGGAAVNPEKWNRVKELFASAIERNPDERRAFLSKACGTDESLLQEVESLLSSHSTTHGTFPEEISAEAFVGRNVGSYQIIREIGRGCMAVVYLAKRADDAFRKRVAIKLLVQGLFGEEMMRRFRNERQTLAALDHPNIVKLLDGGITEQGLPYLVMDYVEGSVITEFCDSRRFSTTERLKLFRTVCQAVDYAHKNLIVHRDLKPSNILVSAEVTPKLLDFGIAKLLNPAFAAEAVLTRTDMRLMTPEYASPEQVRGESVTVESDVYSLGVVLYELLTGHRPYRLNPQSPGGIEHVICEQEPEKPSTAVTHSETTIDHDGTTVTMTPEMISRTHDEPPKELSRRLRGDLDTIVLKALRKEPQHRYMSAGELAEDIRRHLEGLPITARKPTVGYRCSKFVHRHRREALVVLVAVAILAGGFGLEHWQSHRAAFRRVHMRRSVAVLGFNNLSQRPEAAWLSTALSEMLTTELGSGEKLRTIPGENVTQMKINLSLPDADSLGPATLVKVHKSLGVDLVVLGSYADLPDGQIRLDLRLQDAVVGETIAAVADAGTEANLLDLVSRAGSDLRQKLGIGEVKPEETIGVKSSLPSNPEAARLYSEGLSELRTFDAISARDLLEKTVVFEPSFALGHAALAAAWSVLGYEEKAKQEAQRAFELSASLPRVERLWIEGGYREILREWGKAADTYRTLWIFFPDNLEYGLRLADALTSAGKAKDALATAEQLRSLSSPSRDDARIDLVQANAAKSLGDFAGQEAAAARAAMAGEAQGAPLLVARARMHQGWALRSLETDAVLQFSVLYR
jgi:eukaryotic-like serine/threonine-protein kinase